MAVFTDILPPPQSLEHLDNWGDLDGLAWSLDASMWETAGIYGLVASETGHGGGSLAHHRLRGMEASGHAKASCSLEGRVVIEIGGAAGAASDGAFTPFRVLCGALVAEASAASSDVFLRISPLVVLEPALSGGGAAVTRVRLTGNHSSGALSSAVSDGCRVRGGSVFSFILSDGGHEGCRVRTLAAEEGALAQATMEGSRFYTLVAVESAAGGEHAQYVRMVLRGGELSAASAGVMSGEGVMTLSCSASSVADGRVVLVRLVELIGAATGCSGEGTAFEGKGWNWEFSERPSGCWKWCGGGQSFWKPWSPDSFEESSGRWKLCGGGQSSWRRRAVDDAHRRGAVQWR